MVNESGKTSSKNCLKDIFVCIKFHLDPQKRKYSQHIVALITIKMHYKKFRKKDESLGIKSV